MKKRIPVLLVGPLVAVVSMALLPLPVSSQALSTELESMGRSSRQPPPFVATQASDKGGAGAASAPAPFGSNLFTGGFGGERDDGLNPDYIIVPGDRITLRIWGATTFDDQATVDGQGNIFVPDIGPIPVAGTLNAGLTAVIERAVRTVFTQNVFVYTNLEGTSPVVVYVTGYVGRPGSYAGTATDSVLYFLSRAGGVDQARGSYRDVRILRDAKTIAKVDLYEFIMFGRLAGVQFRDGDTVLVGRRGASVSVAGKVRSQFLFEIPESGIEGLELIELVRPDAEASHVTIRGSRVDGAYSDYLTLSEFTSRVVQDGDRVTFEADRRHDTILVEIKGNHLGPSRYAVPTKTTLMRLLDEVEVDPALSDTKSISLRRSSVARQQKTGARGQLAPTREHRADRYLPNRCGIQDPGGGSQAHRRFRQSGAPGPAAGPGGRFSRRRRL